MTDTDVATLDVTTLLERSLSVIRERGLAKNELVDDTGRVCARGAIMVALGAQDPMDRGWSRWRENNPVVGPAERLLSAAAAQVDPHRVGGFYSHDPDYVIAFNNDSRTTQDEMEQVFEVAIEASRGVVTGG